MKRIRGFGPPDDDHVLPHAGADRIERHERAIDGFPSRRDRLQQEERAPCKAGILYGRNDVADDTSDLHVNSRSRASYR